MTDYIDEANDFHSTIDIGAAFALTFLNQLSIVKKVQGDGRTEEVHAEALVFAATLVEYQNIERRILIGPAAGRLTLSSEWGHFTSCIEARATSLQSLNYSPSSYSEEDGFVTHTGPHRQFLDEITRFRRGCAGDINAELIGRILRYLALAMCGDDDRSSELVSLFNNLRGFSKKSVVPILDSWKTTNL